MPEEYDNGMAGLTAALFLLGQAKRQSKAERRAIAHRFNMRRKTPPVSDAECDAMGDNLDPTGELGITLIDYDLETMRRMEAKPDGKRLPPKKLRKHWSRVFQDRLPGRDALIAEIREKAEANRA